MKKQIIEKAFTTCNKVADAINRKNKGQYCKGCCPGADVLIEVLNQLATEIKDSEPECCRRLNQELQMLRFQDCLNPFAFGAVIAIVSVLKMKYVDDGDKKKFFISHSSEDKPFIKSFIKEILKVGCGFKDEDIFCTIDPSAIRTGDDFREKIIENMQKCDYILLFISENYNQSDVCKNEMGAAWALKGKRILPFVLPGISFKQMGFLNVVKQGASIMETRKLDELYQELCHNYDMMLDWPAFNNAKDDFIASIKTLKRKRTTRQSSGKKTPAR